MSTITRLDQIAALFPQFRSEQFGLVATGTDGERLVVTDDGDDLLVGWYADAETDEQIDGLIIPADAEPVEVIQTIHQWLTVIAHGHHITTISPTGWACTCGEQYDVADVDLKWSAARIHGTTHTTPKGTNR